MKFNRVLFLMLVASLAILLSACGTAPVTNWPGMTADAQNVYLANGAYVYTIQLSDGKEITTHKLPMAQFPCDSPSKPMPRCHFMLLLP